MEAEKRLERAPKDLAFKGLTTALALVLPTGYSAQDRKLWLAVALESLKELPADLLERGIKNARLVADHPSKVVPEIFRSVSAELARRKADHKRVLRLIALAQIPAEEPIVAQTVDRMGVEEIRALTPELKRMGLEQGWVTQKEIDAACSE